MLIFLINWITDLQTHLSLLDTR